MKVGDVIGTVEVFGLRSTRLRTPERALVTLANGKLAAQPSELLLRLDIVESAGSALAFPDRTVTSSSRASSSSRTSLDSRRTG